MKNVILTFLIALLFTAPHAATAAEPILTVQSEPAEVVKKEKLVPGTLDATNKTLAKVGLILSIVGFAYLLVLILYIILVLSAWGWGY